MKRLSLIHGGIVLFVAVVAHASVIDTPHNATNGITCATCHNYSLWWQYSSSLAPSHATVVNGVCIKCHDSEAPLGVQTHSGAVISSTNNYHQGTGGWGMGCTDCHNPHYQEQLGWGTDAFLVEGTIDRTTPNNGITNGTVTIAGQVYDQTTIAIAEHPTLKDPENWPLANWAKKTGTDGRGLILSQDRTTNANTFTVLAATATAITVKGKLDPEAVVPDFDSDGPDGPQSPNSHYADTFGLAYGQLIKKSVAVPYSDPDGDGPLPAETRTVKFINPVGGFVDTVTTPAAGICQVCHSLTADHADPENPLPRFRNSGDPTSATDSHADYANGTTFGGTSTCTICHTHQSGFKGNGHDGSDFGWATISYTKADGRVASVDCAACHGGGKSVIALHGYKCDLCHVNESGGGALRVAGSAGSDAVSVINGIDGDPSGATRAATCATCHDRAARPNIHTLPLIHHAATTNNYAANDDCTYCHKSAAMAATPRTVAADHSLAIGLAVTTGAPGSVVNGCDACHRLDAVTGTDYSTHGTGTGAIVDLDPAVFDNPRVHDRCVSCHKTDGGLKEGAQTGDMMVSGYNPGHGTGFLPDLDQATNCLSCHGTDSGLTHLNHSHALTVGNTSQCNWCHVDQIGLNDGAKIDPNNDMVHDACTTCHTISKGIVGDYAVGLVDPLDLTRYPPLVDKMETPLHKGSAVVCNDCHGIHLFADHQRADHTAVVMVSSEGCTESCHIDTDGNGAPDFGMNLDPLNNRIHDECTSCHDTADGRLKTAAEVDRPYVVAMPDGEALPNRPNDGGGECSACHGGAYFARHRAIDHTSRVVASALCSPCHPAASIAGTSTGIPVDPDNNKVHDACSTCHEGNGILKGAYGRASNMPAGGGSCSDCHGDYRDGHNHDHGGVVRVNTATTPATANCVGCHSASTAPFVGPGEVHNRLGCQFCHSTADFTLIGSAAGKSGGGECTTCHSTHFTGHSHTPHLVAMQAGDLAQAAPGTACSACHNDAGEDLATWSAIYIEHRSSCVTCHDATRLTGNPSDPAETVQRVIAANASPTACLACHWDKKSPVGHGGHGADTFSGVEPCVTCHSGAEIVAGVHGNTCTLCHVDSAGGDYRRKAGSDGDATLAGTSTTASCTVCHDQTAYPSGSVHHNNPASGAHADAHLVTLGRTCTACHGENLPPLLADGQPLATTTVCATCHQNGTGGAPNNTGFTAGWIDPSYSPSCTGCHDLPPAYAGSPAKANSHARHPFSCGSCHAATAADGETITGPGNHANGAYDVVAGPGVSFTYTAGTCSNVSCHGGDPATWGATDLFTCLSCHGQALGSRVNVAGAFAGKSHHVQGVTLSNSHCYQCHWEADPAGELTSHHQGVAGGGVDLVVYGAGVRPTAFADGTTAVDFRADGSRAELRKLNSHCLGCHSDQNNTTIPFSDGKTPKVYSAASESVAARYSQSGFTTWGKYPTVGAKKNQQKAFSSHGRTDLNQGGGIPPSYLNTTGSLENVLCFDCHNSHGANISGVTTSYPSATVNGGILKDSQAGKGGYAVSYQPAGGGDKTGNNAYNPGAGLCFDCHLSSGGGNRPWGYSTTFGASQPILGDGDTAFFGNSDPRLTHTGGHLGASSALGHQPTGTINGLCTPCHDPHGVSPGLGANQAYAVPLLKGTWLTSPYLQDAPPPSNWSQYGGYNTDQSTFGTGRITEDQSRFAGLCLSCHPVNALDPDTNNQWQSMDRVHDSVKGWGANTQHSYPCAKCHGPHATSKLPRLLVTNCLDYRHKGRVGYNADPSLSGSDGIYPYGACHQSTNGNAWPNNQGWNIVTPWEDRDEDHAVTYPHKTLGSQEDCDDTNPLISRPLDGSCDGDHDGLVDATAGGSDCDDVNGLVGATGCDGDQDGSLRLTVGGYDCDDNNPAIRDAADGNCDNDKDGAIDYTAGGTSVSSSLDCFDADPTRQGIADGTCDGDNDGYVEGLGIGTDCDDNSVAIKSASDGSCNGDGDAFMDRTAGGPDCDDTTAAVGVAADGTCDGDNDGAIDYTAGGTDCNDNNYYSLGGTCDGDSDGAIDWRLGGNDCNDNDAAVKPPIGVAADGTCDGDNDLLIALIAGGTDCDDSIYAIKSAADGSCDGDADGAIDWQAGGNDCDDDDAAVNPPIGVAADGTCDGDNDGLIALIAGGIDCDDSNNKITSAADGSCDGDADGAIDWHAGGNDCNDGDAGIMPPCTILEGEAASFYSQTYTIYGWTYIWWYLTVAPNPGWQVNFFTGRKWTLTAPGLPTYTGTLLGNTADTFNFGAITDISYPAGALPHYAIELQ